MYDFVKEMYFDSKALGNKSTGDKSLIQFLQSPAIMTFGIATFFSPENPKELCNRISILLQEKKAGNDSNVINENFLLKQINDQNIKNISL